MALWKNEASQYLVVYAHDTAADEPETGNAANITCYLSKDAGAAAQTNDVNPTEMDATNLPGLYAFALTQAETNCDVLVAAPVSATADVSLEPIIVYTALRQTGDSYARLGAPVGASIAADIAVIEGQTDDIGVAGAGLTALGDARLANLDAAVSSRSTLATGAQMDLVDAPNATAITAIQSGLATSGALATAQADLDNPDQYKADVSGIPAAVWAYTTRTLTSLSTLVASIAAAVWAYATRTLTQTAQQIEDALTGSTITVHRGDLFSQQLTLGAIPADRTQFRFTVKADPENEDDDEAILQIGESIGGITAGLLRLNGASGTATQASLTVNDEATGLVTLVIKDTTTAALVRTQGVAYDFQYLDVDGEAKTRAEGTFKVTVDVTRGTS